MVETLRESKAKLSELVDTASRGEDVLITVRGTVKARLTKVGASPAGFDGRAWAGELRTLQEAVKRRREAEVGHRTHSRRASRGPRLNRELLGHLRAVQGIATEDDSGYYMGLGSLHLVQPIVSSAITTVEMLCALHRKGALAI